MVGGLRQLADWLDDHPDAPVCPFGWDLNVYTPADEVGGRAEVDEIAALLGAEVTDETARGGHYTAERSFGLITYRAVHIPSRQVATHRALMSYRDCVTPEGTEVAP
jgi:hypothetical protein